MLGRLRDWSRLYREGRANPGRLYDLLGRGAIVTDGDVPVVNMGLWDGLDPRRHDDIEQANFAMFDLVASGAGLAPHHQVLDAGCGFGTNALRLVRQFDVAKVTGANVSEVQLGIARAAAREAGVAHRTEFLLADVTALPFAPASFDAVVSVEAAFHFDTRERFFAEALRVLKPGGRLSVVDLLPLPPRNPVERAMLDTVRRTLAVPAANVYGIEAYLDRVRAAGFVVEQADSIVKRVFNPFRTWMLRSGVRRVHRYDLAFILPAGPYLLYPFEYARIVARKPHD
jgi:cyclopropane fatty-acyl-phospholipid synthase-like methyltransferase